MRKHFALLVALAFLLFAIGAIAQSSANSQRQTTTTTTTSQTVSGPEHVIEGCVMKEASSFFLIPARGNPIELQTGAQDLTAQEGHKVKVHGVESSLSASGASGATGGVAGTAATASTNPGAQSSTQGVGQAAERDSSTSAGVASATGNDLHRLATKQLTVTKVDSIADTCPVNWNSSVPSKK